MATRFEVAIFVGMKKPSNFESRFQRNMADGIVI